MEYRFTREPATVYKVDYDFMSPDLAATIRYANKDAAHL